MQRRTSWSPPPAPRPVARPPLLKALRADSLVQVHSALRDDPDAARLPFFDHAVDTPLCCAARFGCGSPTMRLLLEHGADVNAEDVRGRTPLAILCAQRPRGALFPNNLAAAQVLLEAGADPLCVDATGRSAIDAARESGNGGLLGLLRGAGFAEEVQLARGRAAP